MIIAPLLANVVGTLLGWTLFFVSLFLILLILVQRGRGGGLTGALGGPGGQSAFGTKAGDLFTKITSFTALGWIALCAFTMWLLGSTGSTVAVNPQPVVSPSPAETSAPAGTGTGTSGIVDLGQPSGEAELTPSQPAIGAAAPADAKPAATDAKPASEESPKPAAETVPPANEPPAEPKAEAAPAQPPAAETPAAPAADAPKSE
jgi:preprotein translocase subunit SecG